MVSISFFWFVGRCRTVGRPRTSFPVRIVLRGVFVDPKRFVVRIINSVTSLRNTVSLARIPQHVFRCVSRASWC